ncbi:Fur family transcriptional regulator [Flavobacterium sp. RSP49]|uniref:Fur family transcriptional regulator n=1 Tax=unclassified Flavobacterium TaxID=196869 RepID=UPI000F82F2FA|nr:MULTISPECIES: transcriptional repressor [unclassified Flavobacterium]RTY88357.1 Fur family transcriptional regulator [Flavobacterium sp. RSP15]RTZ02189.1 Fur family transcriptional regulator [Flavobacterium sp. RSP49]
MKITRNTTAKTAILEIIRNSDVALSHTEIQALSQNFCDRVTIYRVLNRLMTEDVIHKMVTLDGTIKYASCHDLDNGVPHSHNHIHFSCEKCQLVTCLENVSPTFKLPPNYVMKEANFTLSGLCPNCL